ncbi:hypothetical protein POAN111098_00040 [Polynucleobacter antarcticus]
MGHTLVQAVEISVDPLSEQLFSFKPIVLNANILYSNSPNR